MMKDVMTCVDLHCSITKSEPVSEHFKDDTEGDAGSAVLSVNEVSKS